MLADSLFSALGKPGSALQVVLCGTLAPMATGAGHWWFDLVEAGTTGSTYVMKYQGNVKTWDKWATISRCNPLIEISPEFRKKLLSERDAARRDSRLKARFLSYRLNVPSGDESTVLLTVSDWERVTDRPVPPRKGRPIFAYDLGGGARMVGRCRIVAQRSGGMPSRGSGGAFTGGSGKARQSSKRALPEAVGRRAAEGC